MRKSYEKEGFTAPVFEYRPDWPYLSVGFGGEKEYFIENLSLLIASGMGISNALNSLSKSVKTWKMKRVTKIIEEQVDSGIPLWKALQQTKILSDRVISLIKSGEEAGRLPEHLNLVTVQQHKDRTFNSRLKSALIYPGIVMLLAIVVAMGCAWFVLPKITKVFEGTNVSLPFTTRVIIWLGNFLQNYGTVMLPLILVGLILIIYFTFFNKRTKFIGDSILFSIPGIKKLLQGVELARLGYILGALLQAGVHINEALDSIIQSTSYRSYKKFYKYLQENIMQGVSFEKAFESYKKTEKFIPIPIQQLIISSEKSGRLPETLIKVGLIYEEKTDAMSRDIATAIEPIVLIIVGLLVAFVILAIIGPVYDLSSKI